MVISILGHLYLFNYLYVIIQVWIFATNWIDISHLVILTTPKGVCFLRRAKPHCCYVSASFVPTPFRRRSISAKTAESPREYMAPSLSKIYAHTKFVRLDPCVHCFLKNYPVENNVTRLQCLVSDRHARIVGIAQK